MFCKAKKKFFISLCFCYLYLKPHTSRSILPFSVCVELNVSSISSSFMFFGRLPHVWTKPHLNSIAQSSIENKHSVLFMANLDGTPFNDSKLLLIQMLLHSAFFDGTVQKMLTTWSNIGVNVMQNSTKNNVFSQLNVLSPVALLASFVFLKKTKKKTLKCNLVKCWLIRANRFHVHSRTQKKTKWSCFILPMRN